MEFLTEFYHANKKYIHIALGIIIFLVFLLLRKAISKAILSILGKILYNKKPERKEAFRQSLQKPLSSFFALLGLYIGITINYQSKIITDSFKIFTILIVCWSFLCYLSDNIQNIISLKSKSTEVNVVAVKFITNLLKVLIVCIAVVMVLAELGYNINGLITGLGVGGLAVSLSAQDTLKNLISGFVILLDKPFDVGDMIETDEFKGIVEDITCEKEIKAYLEQNELVDNETIRVFFCEYAESSINFQIRCYVNTTDINVYNEFTEALNLEIKKIIENNKTDFAFPTRSIVIENN